ncbi:TPR-like protein [Dioscorea alata]|uniref:TPR-like protein n=1 Tax=Dioscorea alata TaxID=55571 RepID=A0ACB7VXH2_DIOAL|nr:TPR-like protein [Dioscorea alata]
MAKKKNHLPPLSFLADRCTSMRELKQVHALMIMSGRILSDNYAASRILSFAALHPSGHLPHALSLFSHTPHPNSFMFNTLIRAFASSPTPSSAFFLFSHMLRLGLPPGKHTFPFLLKASANLRSFPTCFQIHSHVLKLGLHSDLYVLNGLIRSYSSCGLPRVARHLFDECPERNLLLWTTMVCSYAQNSCSSEAITLFDAMMRAGVEPCGATLSSVLSACARVDGLELGKRIHCFIEEKGIDLGVILGTALVDMYAKNGEVLFARKLFDEMPERNIATWNAMICGLAHHGYATDALELFLELDKGDIAPNDVSFVGVLSACCHAGLVEDGRRFFHSMKVKYGVEPKLEHYGCMVDLLGRSGRLTEAEELIKGMKWRADVVILGALLTACRNHGNVEIAERVVKEMLKLDPRNHGVYVVLSNIYAEAGRWEDVIRLRKVMRHERLNKIPGASYVNDNGDNGLLLSLPGD